VTGLRLSLLAGAGSAVLLIAALGFQAAGYAPCELCILQRWPHVAAVLLAGLVWVTGRVRVLAALGLIAAVVASALAVYHAGVELAWWEGPTHCSGGVGDLARLSTQDLMTQLQAAPVVRCDEIAWSFLGLSMAGWNAILSVGLAGLWALAVRRSGRT
jgi:disulfide bond formation protein DsbB